MKVLLLDNYDSFTYNLYHYLCSLEAEVTVLRNDELSLDAVDAYTHVLISPGPGLPARAGITMPLIEKYHQSKSILGVCLGCQALAEFFGGELYNQNEVAHGITRQVQRSGQSWLLARLPESFPVGLYHSWAIKPSPQLKQNCLITATRQEGIAMALEHPHLPVAGVQFHPESVMTEGGIQILKNWLER